jgi:hypothetical protein
MSIATSNSGPSAAVSSQTVKFAEIEPEEKKEAVLELFESDAALRTEEATLHLFSRSSAGLGCWAGTHAVKNCIANAKSLGFNQARDSYAAFELDKMQSQICKHLDFQLENGNQFFNSPLCSLFTSPGSIISKAVIKSMVKQDSWKDSLTKVYCKKEEFRWLPCQWLIGVETVEAMVVVLATAAEVVEAVLQVAQAASHIMNHCCNNL